MHGRACSTSITNPIPLSKRRGGLPPLHPRVGAAITCATEHVCADNAHDGLLTCLLERNVFIMMARIDSHSVTTRSQHAHLDTHSPLPHEYVKTEALPDAFTWCNKDGVNYCTISRNQHIPRACPPPTLPCSVSTLPQTPCADRFDLLLIQYFRMCRPKGHPHLPSLSIHYRA